MGVEGTEDPVELKAEVDHLQAALANRDVIGQAKGILMERYGLTADEAFARLVRMSQDTNTKLHAVALDVTNAGRSEPTGVD